MEKVNIEMTKEELDLLGTMIYDIDSSAYFDEKDFKVLDLLIARIVEKLHE